MSVGTLLQNLDILVNLLTRSHDSMLRRASMPHGQMCDKWARRWHGPEVATPSTPRRQAAASVSSSATVVSADLESELQSAADDFERGDYIELSPEALERGIVTGASPWPAESRG